MQRYFRAVLHRSSASYTSRCARFVGIFFGLSFVFLTLVLIVFFYFVVQEISHQQPEGEESPSTPLFRWLLRAALARQAWVWGVVSGSWLLF
jgi:hypothetical protein